ncbi:lactate utilization protein B [Streptomyces iconiensis]|uniref:Lactate utilization protein B n=1 Tax=Streptomyces iconiensis TaxID=1384038 RepID=A0ABT7A124_9ACTN|nr:lactate utilization protein B [Streptomyces iconiensis]MDJ1135035.1 lactate utilization protein B [Streptomyces iconiensis]
MARTFVGWPAFPQAARETTRDTRLRENVRRATHTFRDKYAARVGERPDWQELRDSAAAVKDDVLRQLDRYLEQLEERVIEAGGTVYWAADAAEANRIITGLVAETGEREIIKVKSMLTEEIGLDNALAAAGIDTRETDLAQIIIQLGDDLPSHIVVPAVHRNRGQIHDVFVSEMGKHGRPAPPDMTEDPNSLADASRAHLREKFLRAKVAVSGANFMVAETGTLVVVESEGNARMCLTLPEVLISAVGIEKIVPTWRDLEVYLQILARSATGERMSPYVSTWTGVAEGDGPGTFHLVLVDNGRTRALADPVGRQALRCIRCGACMNVCPVYERTGGHAYGSVYPGPIGAVLNPLLKGVGDEQTASLPYASSLCGACDDACPVRIPLTDLLLKLRHSIAEGGDDGAVGEGRDRGRGGPHPVQDKAFKAVGATMEHRTAWNAAVRAAGLAGPLVPERHLPGALGGWTESRAVPPVPKESFRAWWKRTDGGRR